MHELLIYLLKVDMYFEESNAKLTLQHTSISFSQTNRASSRLRTEFSYPVSTTIQTKSQST